MKTYSLNFQNLEIKQILMALCINGSTIDITEKNSVHKMKTRFLPDSRCWLIKLVIALNLFILFMLRIQIFVLFVSLGLQDTLNILKYSSTLTNSISTITVNLFRNQATPLSNYNYI